ncbi:COG1361 S-layer family protein [Halogeometricum luteum]|uniref:DUF11 domain-containing protein n=1 Tax=Halogeometricum luteum TaxID=2950537 RepID=A0ABU2FYY2_9EURY|nr:hypothetical protein [Halogeometricum sp. S3BR5-2]MDS0293740.1 DUF11 domain-containing protein [Halogeometricum sp. S3BR5-2]
MSSKLNRSRSSLVPWAVVAAVVLSSVLFPVVAAPADAAGAHLGVTGVEVRPTSPAPGQQTEFEVSIRNGPNSASAVELSDVYVRAVGSTDDVARIEDAGTLPVGGNVTVPLSASFAEPGAKNLRVTVVGRQSDGSVVRARYPVTVEVEEPNRPQLELSAEEAVSGSRRPVNVTVANGLERDIRQLRVETASDRVNFSVNERVRARLRAGNTTTFTFPARISEPGAYPVDLTLHYVDNGVERSVSRTYEANFDAPTNPGELVLTDVQATQRGGTLELSATAGNVGSSTVEGVVVSVPEASGVEGSRYFVGSVEQSDFSSFTLTSNVEGNVSSVPVEVTYSVGGVERSFTDSVEVDRRVVRRQSPQQGGLPLVPIGGAVLVLVLAAGAFVWWR